LKILKSNNNLTLALLWFGLIVQLLLFAYFVKFDGNEGWYTLYPSLILDGKFPYRDFFYHRLPILPYLYIPALFLPFYKLFSFRLLSTLFILLSYWFAGDLAFYLTKSKWAKVMVLMIAFVSFYPNSFFITAQSYAPFSTFLIIGVWLVSKFSNSKSEYLNPILAGLFFTLAIGLRFGPDPLIISLPFICILFICFNFERKKFSLLLLSFFVFMSIILVFCTILDKDSFLWGVYIWPFNTLNYISENGADFALNGLMNYLKIKFTYSKRENILLNSSYLFL